MFKSKFVFAVSFVALFAVGSAWAADSDAGIAGVSYVDRLLSGKQDTLVPETNIKGAGSVTVSKGTDGAITISGTDTKYTLPNATTSTKGGVIVGTNISVTSSGTISVADATADVKGVGKLYAGTGGATDGSMTQKAITSALGGKQATISDLATIRSGASAGATAVQPGDLGSLASKSTITNADVATNAAIAQSKIANLTTDLAAKQDNLVPGTNIKGAGSVTVTKGSDGAITISGTDTKYTLPDATKSAKGGVIVGTNISVSNGTISVADATASTKGVAKLYAGTGDATDGSMTQGAITSALSGKFANTSTVKKAIVTTDSNGNVAPVVISDSGTGTYITGVTVSNSGAVELSRGTPTAVNNATLTIQKNGVEVGTFTANSSSNKTINITVPTGSLASKSTITNADVANNAAIAQSKIAGLGDALNGKVDKNQGIANAGKGLVVDAQGALALVDVATQAELDDAVSDLEGQIDGISGGVGTELNNFKTTIAADIAAKVSIDQKAENANKAVITNGDGQITTGQIVTGMIANTAVTTAKIANTAVTADKIANTAVTTAKIANTAVTTEKIAANAVTVAKTTGIYGYIPTKSDGTGSAQIWVE